MNHALPEASPVTTSTWTMAQNTPAPQFPLGNDVAEQASNTTLPAPADVGDPWSSVENEPTRAADSPDNASTAWETGGTPDAPTDTGADWLATPAPADPGTDAAGWHLQQLWDGSLPVGDGINHGLTWFVDHFRPFFQNVRAPIDATLTAVQQLLQSVPTLAMIAIIGLVAWQLASGGIAVAAVVAMLAIAFLGIWPDAMVTLSLVLTSLTFCVLIGLPMGILFAASDRAQRIARPLLDAMQTTPAFVYLVPVVMLFGIGNVPGVIVTIVFALPPLVRLTNLGIRQVRPDLVEAARAFGASRWQLLSKVQLPLAMPSIMAGVNQALMLSLSMVVIASMIAVGGLGQMVLRGIGRLDMGLATIGGLGIVLLAVTLDRITQAMGQARRNISWFQRGPVGLVAALCRRIHAARPQGSVPPDMEQRPVSG